MNGTDLKLAVNLDRRFASGGDFLRTRESVCERDIKGLIFAFKSFETIEVKELYIRCLENFVGNPGIISEGICFLKDKGSIKASRGKIERLK